ncbi:unnamed protein product [Pylaiella littoralis]
MHFLSLICAYTATTAVVLAVVAAGDGDSSNRSKTFPIPTATHQAVTTAGAAGAAARAGAAAVAAARKRETPPSTSWTERPAYIRQRQTIVAAAAAAAAAAAKRQLDAFQLAPSSSPPWCMIRGGSRMSQKSRHAQRESEEQQPVRNVLLFYPNLIGYARVALVLTSYYLAETNWKASSCLYLVAFAGDAVDGHVARKFNQASRFGAVLDMVTDRCSTAGLLLVLSRLYDRRHAFAFLVLMFIDLFSHWMHTHSVVDEHHKSTVTLKRRNILIRTYYDRLPFFAFCCIGTELFYVLLYLLRFVSPGSRAFAPLRKICFWGCLPACVLKQLINVAQIGSAARTLALEELDQKR